MSILKETKRRLVILTCGAVLAVLTASCALPWGPDSRRVNIGGVSYDRDSTEIIISQSDFNDFDALRQMPSLQTLDLTQMPLTIPEYERIAASVDENLKIIWCVPMGSERILNTTTKLHVTEEMLSDAAAAAPYFCYLKTAEIDESPLSSELYGVVQTLRTNNPDAELIYRSRLYGQPIDSQQETVYLNAIPIDDLAELRQAIAAFPNVTTYEMCRCGLSNEVMGALREEFPNVNFVWEISFSRFTVRTDIQAFSTLEYTIDRSSTQDTYLPLFRYCTELRALDLGHHGITDISEITHLKKLQTLILADNWISDITPLAELKDLNYLEIFFNRVENVEPLTGLANLEDLNLCYNKRIQNPTALARCQKLNRLYISHCDISAADLAQIRQGLPAECEFNSTVYNAVNEGWRSNEKNAAIRKAFKNWASVKEYHRWDDVVYG